MKEENPAQHILPHRFLTSSDAPRIRTAIPKWCCPADIVAILGCAPANTKIPDSRLPQTSFSQMSAAIADHNHTPDRIPSVARHCVTAQEESSRFIAEFWSLPTYRNVMPEMRPLGTC